MAKKTTTKPAKAAGKKPAAAKTAPAGEPKTAESLFEKLNRTAREATGLAQKAASDLTDAAREKAMSIIDGWVEVLPRLAALGLENRSFGLSMGLNPSLRLELFGSVGAMTTERIDQILEENGDSSYVKIIFQAVRATVALHERSGAVPVEPLIVQVMVKLSPEITVFIGKPV